MKERGLDKLRLGDVVAIHNAHHRFGRGYRAGHVAIALCIQGDSVMTGHGPGILTRMTGTDDTIEWIVYPSANLTLQLNVREDL